MRRRLGDGEMMEETRCGDHTWVNIQEPSQQEIEALGRRYNFHQLDLEDCLSKRQLNKIDEYEDYIFTVLHFPYLQETSRMFTSSQVSVFLSKDYLVTVHKGDLKPLSNIFQGCKGDEQQRKILLGKSPAFLLYSILDALVDDVFPLVEGLLADLDYFEDSVFDERIETVREVTILRRKMADLRRSIIPLRHVVKELSAKIQKFGEEDIAVYFGDVIDHVEKICEALEGAKETIEIYKDTDFMLNTQKSNKILTVLTIIFTLSIPATVIGAFYGMNIPLPGGIQTGAWHFLGPYTTLIIVTITSVIPALLLIMYFRRLGWI